MKRLKGKTAVVTGGTKGIGKAIASALAIEGCNIAIASRTEAELKAVQKELSGKEVEVIAIHCDVRNVHEVSAMAKKVQRKFGSPEILINNAGIGRFGEVLKMEERDFRATLETNLLGVFHCTQAFLQGMMEKREGFIINIGSLAGKNSFAGGSAYCASKHGLISFSECLMMEVRNYDIKVSTICPGTVQTNFSPGFSEKSWALTPNDVAKVVIDILTSSAGSLVSLVDLRPLRPASKR